MFRSSPKPEPGMVRAVRFELTCPKAPGFEPGTYTSSVTRAWCLPRDSNPQSSRRPSLSRTCIPIPPGRLGPPQTGARRSGSGLDKEEGDCGYGVFAALAHAGDVDPGCGHIDDRDSIHFIYSPVPAEWPVTQTINNTKRPPASYKTNGP